MTTAAPRRQPPKPQLGARPSAKVGRKYDNLVLVIPHKHGSTWLFKVFTDQRMLSALGMEAGRDIEPLSKGGPWSYDWPAEVRLAPGELAYTRLLAPEQLGRAEALASNHRTLYVHRDPRDVIISHYFSLRFSHGLRGNIDRIRDDLRGMSFSEGLRHVIGLNLKIRRYEMQRRWQNHPDPRILRVRYEDLILDPLPGLIRACRHFGADVAPELLQEVLEEYSFEKISGRKLGQVDVFAHQRSGLPGQWKLYLDPPAVELLRKEAGGLIEQLGYEPFERQEKVAPINDLLIDWTPELEQTLRHTSEALNLFGEDRILFYGAGLDLRAICACTMLYGRSNILGAIDDNPDLHGTAIGGQCEVHPPEALEGLRPDVIVINSSNYRQELYRKARALVKRLPFHVDVFY